MALRCANCNAHFSAAEIMHKPALRHPWAITAAGQRAMDELARLGQVSPACPGCGARAFLGASNLAPAAN